MDSVSRRPEAEVVEEVVGDPVEDVAEFGGGVDGELSITKPTVAIMMTMTTTTTTTVVPMASRCVIMSP